MATLDFNYSKTETFEMDGYKVEVPVHAIRTDGFIESTAARVTWPDGSVEVIYSQPGVIRETIELAKSIARFDEVFKKARSRTGESN